AAARGVQPRTSPRFEEQQSSPSPFVVTPRGLLRLRWRSPPSGLQGTCGRAPLPATRWKRDGHCLPRSASLCKPSAAGWIAGVYDCLGVSQPGHLGGIDEPQVVRRHECEAAKTPSQFLERFDHQTEVALGTLTECHLREAPELPVPGLDPHGLAPLRETVS